MKQIWKYPLPIRGLVEIPTRRNAQPLSVGEQERRPVLWMLVDPTEPELLLRVHVVFTGEPFDPNGWKFVGTTHIEWVVSHIFVQEQ
jgi:hypothetical protein